jgi:hypothetical protein
MKYVFLVFACFSLCGCLSSNTIDAAKGHPRPNKDGETISQDAPQPALYLLLPLTFPIDVVFYPVEFISTVGMRH